LLSLPRPRRHNIPGIPQHVTQRGNNRQACLFKGDDRQACLELLHEAALRRVCSVHAYVLMTNHVHLLLTPDTAAGVSRLMQDIGTLFERRFKSSLVDSEAHCLACYRYIELNPVRAAMVISPEDYRWSSIRTNALGATDPLITPHEQWLELGKNDEIRRKAYRALFDGNVPCTQVEKIRYTNRKVLPLGSKSFLAEIESQLKRKLGSGKVGRPRKEI